MKTNGLTLVFASFAVVGAAACGSDETDVPAPSADAGINMPPPADAGSEAPDSGVPAAVTFARVFNEVIEPNCSCHLDPNIDSGGLDFTNQITALTRLIGQPTTPGGPCAGNVRVMPGSPTNSVLYRKVSGENLCGSRMPYLMPPLADEDIELIRAWIADGAIPQ